MSYPSPADFIAPTAWEQSETNCQQPSDLSPPHPAAQRARTIPRKPVPPPAPVRTQTVVPEQHRQLADTAHGLKTCLTQMNGRPATSADTKNNRHSFADLISPSSPSHAQYEGKTISLEEARRRDEVRLRGFASHELGSAFSPYNSPTSSKTDLLASFDEYKVFASKVDAALFMTSKVAYVGKNKWRDMAENLKDFARSVKQK
ncbi:hypothetical protein CERZMDRAFT_94027 [Cercospora zeae-maydis SCOH1-5]|uniref:Uncharacterized protein n=1 Tax=Cercospora zeae-maydis SCOH1-5 TaxID=717836 RepID=A0A6A6FQP8_9PEZI|nr:hypothetical protein CERZMDRAFT_94027 [Cercospora zeae-maydis SCOH1-5]